MFWTFWVKLFAVATGELACRCQESTQHREVSNTNAVQKPQRTLRLKVQNMKHFSCRKPAFTVHICESRKLVSCFAVFVWRNSQTINWLSKNVAVATLLNIHEFNFNDDQYSFHGWFLMSYFSSHNNICCSVDYERNRNKAKALRLLDCQSTVLLLSLCCI